MRLTKEQVEHLAQLARLELTDSEKERFSRDLSSILEYVEKLKKIDTKDITITAQPSGLPQVARKDESADRSEKETERLIEAAPKHEKRFVKTKPVFSAESGSASGGE